MIELKCGIQHYPWGQRPAAGGKPFIVDLLGLDPGDDEPFAELWMGAHPKLPALAVVGRCPQPLDELIAAQPVDILGEGLVARGFDKLPFLLKIVACERSLSIQAHPDMERAASLHARDPRHYPDANHKPEIAIAISEMTALCQFRPANEIQAHIERLPGLAEFLAGAAAEAPVGSKKWLRRLYERILTAGEAGVASSLATIGETIRERGPADEADEWFVEMASRHPGDRGVLSVYFLNILRLAAGEGIFLAPNEPHAYLKGVVVECMASSDNVVRAGLTAKFIDRETLVEMLTYNQGLPEIDRGEEVVPGERIYRAPTPEFQVELYDHEAGDSHTYQAGGTVSILLVLSGAAILRTPRGAVDVRKGGVWLWPANVASCEIDYCAAGTRIVRARPNMMSIG